MNIRELVETDKKDGCKGLYWKCQVNTYMTSDYKMEEKKTLKLLKRKSCKGCAYCVGTLNLLEDCFYDILPCFNNLKHGKIYKVVFAESQGYYDLYPEIEDLNFVEVEFTKDEN
jgi:hypothetical protein